MPNLYRLKISLLEPHRPISALHRIIDVRGDVAFFELQQAITQYFNCATYDTWRFIITRQKLETLDTLKAHQEFVSNAQFSVVHSPTATVETLHLALKDYVYLWLTTDNNAELVFRIRLEKIAQVGDGFANVQLIKSVGEMPISPKINKNDNADFEMSLISALMLIATGGDGEPVRWQELVDNGVAHELVKRNLIKPCVNPMHIVKMTKYGESELIRVLGDMSVLK